MALERVYANGTNVGQWSATPVQTHHLCVIQAYPPGDTTSYLKIGGAGGLLEDHSLPLPSGSYERVRAVQFGILLSGELIASAPGLQVILIINGVAVGQASFNAYTEGVWLLVLVRFDGLDYAEGEIESVRYQLYGANPAGQKGYQEYTQE